MYMYLFEWGSLYFKLIVGVTRAAERRQKQGKESDDNKYLSKFMLEMSCIVAFADIVAQGPISSSASPLKMSGRRGLASQPC